MKILFEAHSLIPPRTGIGRSTYSLIQQLLLHPQVEQISLFFSIMGGSRKWQACLNHLNNLGLNLTIHRIPIPYGILLCLWNYIEQPKLDYFFPAYDILHGPAHVLPSTSKAAGVITVHDTTLLEHPEWYPAQGRYFSKQIIKGVDKAEQVIVPSEWVKYKLAEVLPESTGKTHVVTHNLPIQSVCLSSEEKSAAKRVRLGIDFPYLFWTGEINPRKNVSLLFQLLKDLRKRGHSDLRLIIAGSKGYRSDEILAQAGDLGLSIASPEDKLSKADILHYGFVSDEMLATLYACAEVFVFPSWDEGFGFPVLEAMASGVPIVCSSLGSLTEICGDSTILINPNQGVEPFAEAIHTLLNDHTLYKSFQDKGLQRQEDYLKNDMADKTVQVYKQALKVRK